MIICDRLFCFHHLAALNIMSVYRRGRPALPKYMIVHTLHTFRDAVVTFLLVLQIQPHIYLCSSVVLTNRPIHYLHFTPLFLFLFLPPPPPPPLRQAQPAQLRMVYIVSSGDVNPSAAASVGSGQERFYGFQIPYPFEANIPTTVYM